jgi:hypothetical protein
MVEPENPNLMESYFDDERMIIGTLVVLALLAGAAAYYRHRKDQGDTGMGDTTAHLLQRLGIEKTPKCGCAARQQAMNQMVPY